MQGLQLGNCSGLLSPGKGVLSVKLLLGVCASDVGLCTWLHFPLARSMPGLPLRVRSNALVQVEPCEHCMRCTEQGNQTSPLHKTAV